MRIRTVALFSILHFSAVLIPVVIAARASSGVVASWVVGGAVLLESLLGLAKGAVVGRAERGAFIAGAFLAGALVTATAFVVAWEFSAPVGDPPSLMAYAWSRVQHRPRDLFWVPVTPLAMMAASLLGVELAVRLRRAVESPCAARQ